MSSGPYRFRGREVSRALRAVRAAGAAVDRVEIDTDGKIVVHLADGAGEAGKVNSADAVLEKLRHHGKHGQRGEK